MGISATNFHLDSNLARAATIPADWYTDPGYLKLEQQKVFRRTWQYAATLEQLRFPGNYVAVDVAQQPLFLGS